MDQAAIARAIYSLGGPVVGFIPPGLSYEFHAAWQPTFHSDYSFQLRGSKGRSSKTSQRNWRYGTISSPILSVDFSANQRFGGKVWPPEERDRDAERSDFAPVRSRRRGGPSRPRATRAPTLPRSMPAHLHISALHRTSASLAPMALAASCLSHRLAWLLCIHVPVFSFHRQDSGGHG